MSDQPNASHHDAELILQLYDLRRESEMRKARTFIANFWPQSADEVLKVIQSFGAQENAWFRQVLGYWNMVASLVLRGTLHEGLAFDNCAELWFVYAKLKPFLRKSGKRCKCRSSWETSRKLPSAHLRVGSASKA